MSPLLFFCHTCGPYGTFRVLLHDKKSTLQNNNTPAGCSGVAESKINSSLKIALLLKCR